MDEEQSGLFGPVGFGAPAVDDSAVAEVGGGGLQPGGGEGAPVTPVSRCCEAETLVAHFSLKGFRNFELFQRLILQIGKNPLNICRIWGINSSIV